MLKHYLPTLISFTVLAVVLFFRMRKAGRGRPLKPNRLWIRPAILAAFGGLVFLHPAPVTPLNLAIFAAAAAVGVVTGYILASHQQLTVDPASGSITSRMSPVGMMLFVGLIAARYLIRMVAIGPDPDQAAAASPQALLYTDTALLFAFGLVAAQAWETWHRAKRALEAAAKKPESLAE